MLLPWLVAQWILWFLFFFLFFFYKVNVSPPSCRGNRVPPQVSVWSSCGEKHGRTLEPGVESLGFWSQANGRCWCWRYTSSDCWHDSNLLSASWWCFHVWPLKSHDVSLWINCSWICLEPPFCWTHTSYCSPGLIWNHWDLFGFSLSESVSEKQLSSLLEEIHCSN